MFNQIALLCAVLAVARSSVIIDNLVIPENCDNTAQSGDSILLTYSLDYADASLELSGKSSDPMENFYLLMPDDINSNDLSNGIKGMCPGYTRKLSYETTEGIDLDPLFSSTGSFLRDNHAIDLTITIQHVTGPKEFAIFDAIHSRNTSGIIDLIDDHRGINARDQQGATPLMLITQQGALSVIAALLNARMPKVNTNLAKPTGYTALFYAIPLTEATILQAILRRGADPNVALLQESGQGNTPLHFACFLEKTNHAAILFSYGADPYAVNNEGKNALQMLPSDASPSVKKKMAKMFNVS